MNLVNRFWNDEAGFIVSSELVLLAVITVFGILVGLQTVRDAVISELADAATAVGQINQSYSFGGVTGHASSISGSSFNDETDFCDDTTSGTTDFTGCVASIAATVE